MPMPVEVHGVFVLTLKFSEVYFDKPGQKVFDVALNDHVVIDDLDVFKKVGKNAAYDESIEFRIDNSTTKILVGKESVPYDGQLVVRFIPSG